MEGRMMGYRLGWTFPFLGMPNIAMSATTCRASVNIRYKSLPWVAEWMTIFCLHSACSNSPESVQ